LSELGRNTTIGSPPFYLIEINLSVKNLKESEINNKNELFKNY